MLRLFRKFARFFGRSVQQQRQRVLCRRRLSLFDVLEDRRLMATIINLSPVNSISSYDGVGVTKNVVADCAASVGGALDKNAGHYTAQIDWGDGGGYETGEVVLKGENSSAPFQIKGSHVYHDFGVNHTIHVKVTGQGGKADDDTCSCFTSEMPSGLDGEKPPVQESAGKEVTVALSPVNSFSAYAGVGFELNELADLRGTLNGQADPVQSHYKAYVNWSDDSSWTQATLAPNPGSSAPFIVKGTHNYDTPGQYSIVVYAVQQDGTSVSDETTSIVVQQMPSGLPGERPKYQDRARDPSNVGVSLSPENGIQAYAKVELVEAAVAEANASINDVFQTDPALVHAQINWGDSSDWSIATVVANDSGSSVKYQILGTHTYNDVGQFHVVVYLNGPDGTSVADETTSVHVVLPKTPILTGSATTSVEQGDDVPGPIATFDPNTSSTPPDQLKAKVDWGDGDPQQNAPILKNGTGKYDVNPPAHKYLKPGTYTSVVTVVDTHGDESNVTNKYQVTPQQTDLAIGVQTYRIVPTAATDLNLSFFFGNEKINVPVVVRNVGGTAATGNATINVYLSTTPTITGSSKLLVTKSVSLNLAGGAQQIFYPSAAIPTSLSVGGHYYVLAKLSAPSIQEYTLANNVTTGSRSFEFVGTPASNPTVFTGTSKIFYGFVRNTIKHTPNIPASINRTNMTSFIGFFEGSRQDPYLDANKKGHPSIGIGINLDSVGGQLKKDLAADVRKYYLATYKVTLSSDDTAVISMLKSEAQKASHKKALAVADINNLFAEALPTYVTIARNALGAATYDALNNYQKVAVVSMAYNLGSLSDFPTMVAAFKSGDLLQAGFQLCDAIRTTQATGLTRRTGVEFANFFAGRENLLGQLSQ